MNTRHIANNFLNYFLIFVVFRRSGPAIFLAQTAVAIGVEALQGRLESFHPVIHDNCLPHPGQSEVARNIRFNYTFINSLTFLSHQNLLIVV